MPLVDKVEGHPAVKVATVAVDAAAPSLYSYLVPAALQGQIEVGQAVAVPLGRREVMGYVLRLAECRLEAGQVEKLKPVKSILCDEPLFGPSLAELVSFASGYYFCPPGVCVKEILPGGLSPKLEKYVTMAVGGAQWPPRLIGAEADLLNRLEASQPLGVSWQDLQKEGFEKTVTTLVKEGLLRISYQPLKSALTTKYEYWLAEAETPPASPRRLGPKEEELWSMIKGGPPKPLAYFKNYLKTPLIQAKSLAAKGLISISQAEVMRDDPTRAIFLGGNIPDRLTDDQQNAYDRITAAIGRQEYQGFLLFGVTGSGKTEVYLRSAQKTLESGREVLWLAPEIALTLGLEGQLKDRFGADNVAVLHSGLTPGQRYDQWLNIRRGGAKLVLGARSAVFAPLENIGLVVVDEEHDWAYKQEDGLRYQARDLALWRGRAAGAAVVLGSATPSLESFNAALEGRLALLKMLNRAGAAILPKVEIIDLRAASGFRREVLNPRLSRQLKQTLDKGQQALLFVNWRGISNLPMCLACGEVVKCPHCSISLTLHGAAAEEADNGILPASASRETLVCHRCGYRATPPKQCPACQSPLFRYLGVGTERLLNLVEKHFDNVRGLRLDADSVKQRGGLKKILSAFAKQELNLLVGTQMAAKGHNFPNLTLVGVVEADQGLNLPDFRAAERTFQLLSQVAGRAGRDEQPGVVIIQTRNPDHYVLKAVEEHDYEEFFRHEITIRQELSLPPFGRLALLRLSGPDEEGLTETAEKALNAAQDFLAGFSRAQLELFGPAPSPVARLREKYRFQFMVRADGPAARHRFLSAWLPVFRSLMPPQMHLAVDVDPYHLM